MNYNKLPADPSALILGIAALVISFAGCCCGIFAIIPLAMSIIGLVLANKSLREYTLNPVAYDPQSRSNVNTAKIINIIALIVSGIVTLLYTAYFAIYGIAISEVFMEAYEAEKNGEAYKYEWEEDDWDNDTLQDEASDVYIIESDSINLNPSEEIEPLDSLNLN
ncbi:CCC motif membrane protein [Psychroserpens sp. BH13MA-6]